LYGTKAHAGYCQVKSPFVPLTVQQQNSKQQEDGAALNQSRLSPSTAKLVKRLGLKHITTDELTIRRRRHGDGFGYLRPDGTRVTTAEKRRLAALAVP
jgi:DNA topoisomerase IB